MRNRNCLLLVVLIGGGLLVGAAKADSQNGLKQGTPEIKSAGPLAFGPSGVLFIGDTKSAAVFAIDTGDAPDSRAPADVNVNNIGKKIGSLLGTSRQNIQINDLAVNPLSGNVYLSVTRTGSGQAQPALIKVTPAGEVTAVSLKDIPFAKADLPNPPEDKEIDTRRGKKNDRNESITDLAFFDDRVYVAGLSNEDFASKLRSLAFPFDEADTGTSVEIFHASHGKMETHSPVRTFVPFDIGGEPHLLASYTCTPLVTFPVSQLTPDAKVTGKTVAELGNRNRPLDMIVYEQDGQRFVMMANSARGVMKFSAEGIDKVEPLTEKVPDKAGHPYETIEELKGVVQLDKLDDASAIVLVSSEAKKGEKFDLKTVPLP